MQQQQLLKAPASESATALRDQPQLQQLLKLQRQRPQRTSAAPTKTTTSARLQQWRQRISGRDAATRVLSAASSSSAPACQHQHELQPLERHRTSTAAPATSVSDDVAASTAVTVAVATTVQPRPQPLYAAIATTAQLQLQSLQRHVARSCESEDRCF